MTSQQDRNHALKDEMNRKQGPIITKAAAIALEKSVLETSKKFDIVNYSVSTVSLKATNGVILILDFSWPVLVQFALRYGR